MNEASALQDQKQIEQLPESEQKTYYASWLEAHPEKTVSYVKAALEYAKILYRGGCLS